MDSQAEKGITINKGGRPTKYRDDLPEQLLAFFDIELDTIVQKEVVAKDQVTIINEIRPNRLPTVEGFCRDIKISKRTFHDWVAKYPAFSHALGIAKQMQMNHLIQHALEGTYNAGFAKFLAQNISDYRDKIEQTVDGEIKINQIDLDNDDKGL